MKKLIVALMKKKLFKNAGGGIKYPHHIKRSHHIVRHHSNHAVVIPHEGAGYKKMHHGLKNLSIKPLKFKF